MGFSLVLLGVLHAAEPTAVWTPGVSQLGHEGLVSGEFDGHEGLDWAASYRSGDASGIVIQLSGTGQDWFLETEENLSGMRLLAGDWDSDSDDEILIGLPNYGLGGAAGVLDLSGLQELSGSLEEATAFWVESTEDASQFGTDLFLVDCAEGGNAEIIVSAPQSRMNGTVYAFSAESGASALGTWTVKWESSNRFGYALALRESSEAAPEMLVASCDYDPDLQESCASDGQLWRVSLEACNTTVSLNLTDAELGGLQPTPVGLTSLMEGSTEAGLVLWRAPQLKRAVNLEQSQVMFSIETSDDSGEFLQTEENGESQSWLVSSGKVWKIPGALDGVTVEDTSHRNFEKSDQDPLGLRLAPAGDLDADGCPDVLTSAGDGEALWLLSGCEAEPVDTGSPGDTGPNPDTDSPEDTGDLGDSGEPVCEEDFGWHCAVGAPTWRPGFWGLLVGLFCLNRRRKTD